MSPTPSSLSSLMCHPLWFVTPHSCATPLSCHPYVYHLPPLSLVTPLVTAPKLAFVAKSAVLLWAVIGEFWIGAVRDNNEAAFICRQNSELKNADLTNLVWNEDLCDVKPLTAHCRTQKADSRKVPRSCAPSPFV